MTFTFSCYFVESLRTCTIDELALQTWIEQWDFSSPSDSKNVLFSDTEAPQLTITVNIKFQWFLLYVCTLEKWFFFKFAQSKLQTSKYFFLEKKLFSKKFSLLLGVFDAFFWFQPSIKAKNLSICTSICRFWLVNFLKIFHKISNN